MLISQTSCGVSSDSKTSARSSRSNTATQRPPDNDYNIDGIVELDYESTEAMEAGWASEAGQRALADTDNFLDRHSVVVTQDHVIVDDS